MVFKQQRFLTDADGAASWSWRRICCAPSAAREPARGAAGAGLVRHFGCGDRADPAPLPRRTYATFGQSPALRSNPGKVFFGDLWAILHLRIFLAIRRRT